mmetsp:Transcript_34057/g.78692  ORF Transcript_34057/g.78692 Transcript_34057/m.78692 type:complete len:299 (+) Transcript_34057:1248-2144(+)
MVRGPLFYGCNGVCRDVKANPSPPTVLVRTSLGHATRDRRRCVVDVVVLGGCRRRRLSRSRRNINGLRAEERHRSRLEIVQRSEDSVDTRPAPGHVVMRHRDTFGWAVHVSFLALVEVVVMKVLPLPLTLAEHVLLTPPRVEITVPHDQAIAQTVRCVWSGGARVEGGGVGAVVHATEHRPEPCPGLPGHPVDNLELGLPVRRARQRLQMRRAHCHASPRDQRCVRVRRPHQPSPWPVVVTVERVRSTSDREACDEGTPVHVRRHRMKGHGFDTDTPVATHELYHTIHKFRAFESGAN